MPIDFKHIVQRAGDLRVIARAGSDGKLPCPFHGRGQERTPSLHIYEHSFRCYACGEHGDTLDWIARTRGLSLIDAARTIDDSIGRAPGGHRSNYRASTSNASLITHEPPMSNARAVPEPPKTELPPVYLNPGWQTRVGLLVDEAEARLWSPLGGPALEWLRARGLTDDTIRWARLGYVDRLDWSTPIPIRVQRTGNAKGLYYPRGIVIPWLAPGAWRSPNDDEEAGPSPPRWAGVKFRRLAEGNVSGPLSDGPKCLAVWGSESGLLFPEPEILPTQGYLPMLLVEGEFDALIGWQEVGHLLHVGTAGSASMRKLAPSTEQALARCRSILLAFDHDPAGVEAVGKWRDRFPHKARRVMLPHGKDLNDFHRAGGNVREWVAGLLKDPGRRTAT